MAFSNQKRNVTGLSLPSTLSDAEFLAAEFRRGKPKAFEMVFDKHYAALCYFANSFVGDWDESEDIVAAVFIKLWELKDSFPNLRAVKSFLYVSVKNACLNHIRRGRIIRVYQNGVLPALQQEEQDDHVLGKIFEAEVVREF